MNSSKTILDQEFLTARCKLLEVAAILDRIDRGQGDVQNELPMIRLRKAIDILHTSQDANRAEQIQKIMSREYEPTWPEKFALTIGNPT